MEFAKVFDKVLHIRLGETMEASGFGGNLLRWIDNWLQDRRQRVGIREEFSELIDVISGVPLGSVLGRSFL